MTTWTQLITREILILIHKKGPLHVEHKAPMFADILPINLDNGHFRIYSIPSMSLNPHSVRALKIIFPVYLFIHLPLARKPRRIFATALKWNEKQFHRRSRKKKKSMVSSWINWVAIACSYLPYIWKWIRCRPSALGLDETDIHRQKHGHPSQNRKKKPRI